jgi:hypothetical protein
MNEEQRKHLAARRRNSLTVFISMTWKNRGGRKVIIAPDGGDAWAFTKARPDETLIRALASTHRWKDRSKTNAIRTGCRAGRGGEVHSVSDVPSSTRRRRRSGQSPQCGVWCIRLALPDVRGIQPCSASFPSRALFGLAIGRW